MINIIWINFDYLLRFIFSISLIIISAHFLDIYDFGILTFFLSMSSFVLSFCRLGLDNIIPIHVSKEIGSYQSELNLIKNSQIIQSIFALIIVFLIIVFSIQIGFGQYLLWPFVIIALSAILQIYEFYLYGKFQGRLIALIKSSVSVFYIIFKLIIIIYFNNLTFLLLVCALEHLTYFLILKIYSTRFYNLKLNCSTVKYDYGVKKVFKLIKPLLIINICSFSYLKIDQILIPLFLDLKSLALYNSALKICEYENQLFYLISLSFLPLLSTSSLDKKNLYIKAFRSLFLITSCSLFFTFLVYGESILTLIYRDEFGSAHTILTLLSFSCVLSSIITLENRINALFQNLKYTSYIYLIALVVNLTLGVVLINFNGLVGLATSNIITYCIIFGLIFFYKKEKQNGI